MEFCLTLDIIGDYFTKSLQGSQLRRLRNIIIGIHEDDIPVGGLLRFEKNLFWKIKK